MTTATLTPRPQTAPVPQQTPRPMRTQPTMRILLVEDEPLTAEVFARALSRDGHVVELARDGQQALRRFADHRPSLVVLDVSLPTLSGTDVVRRLRADGHRQVPILVVSGSARQLTNLRDDELRPGTWLEKPIKPRDLVRIVREHLAACL